MKYKEKIISYCESLGLDTLGFIRCRNFHELRTVYQYRKNNHLENEFEEESIELRINPKHYMKEGKTIISIAFPYLYKSDFKNSQGFSVYTQGKDYHTVVREYLNRICDYIEKNLGGKALALVDNNTLPERYIAYLANIGFIGKNNMVITSKYGSYVFLGEIITNLELEPEEYEDKEKSLDSINLYKECGNCNICMRECPTKAINEEKRNNNICLSYITQKKQIEDKWFSVIDGRVFGCDSCQKICPYNINAELSNIKEFTPFDHIENLDLEEIISMDNKTFKERYAITASAWRGKALLQRNALIRAFNLGDIENIDITHVKSPYVIDYYNRLLNYFKL